MLWLAYGQVHWLQDEISKHEDLTTFDARVLLESHRNERDRVAHVAKTALDAGVAERQIRLAEMYGEIIARLLGTVLDDLQLTPGQRKRAPGIVRRRLLALERPEERVALDPPATIEGKAKRTASER